jgi:hypothetical protein
MKLTVVAILTLAALVFVLAHMASQTWAPLWLSVLLLVIIACLQVIPLG